MPFTGAPAGEVTMGSGCTLGLGKACSTSTRSSSTPTPFGGETGRIGKNAPRSTAERRSLNSVPTSSVLAREVALEQVVVLGLLDDRLDEGGPGVRWRGVASREQTDHPGDRTVLDDGPVRRARVTEGAAHRLDRGGEVRPRLVEVA